MQKNFDRLEAGQDRRVTGEDTGFRHGGAVPGSGKTPAAATRAGSGRQNRPWPQESRCRFFSLVQFL